jgi:hypothetical protein
VPPDASSKLAWETSSRPTSEQKTGMQYSHSHPGINQHTPLDRLTPRPTKKTTE